MNKVLKNILIEIRTGLVELLSLIPFSFGRYIRYAFYKPQLKKCGGYFGSFIGTQIFQPNRVSIGKNCWLGRYLIISSQSDVSIGNNVLIAPFCQIHGQNHKFDDINTPIVKQGHTTKPITIEDDVWIGSQSIIFMGVKLGKGCVIGANSFVNKDVPPYEVWAGSPAKFIRKRG